MRSMARPMSVSALALAAVLTVVPAAAQNATLTVIHGIPGLPAPVEVCVDGSCLFSFDYGDIRGPLALPAGTYPLEVRLQGSVVLSATPTLSAGAAYTAVAHLQGGGGLALAAFADDLSPATAFDGRLVVRHLADAPAVDAQLRPGGTQLFATAAPNLVNGQSVSADLQGGAYDVRLTAAGTNSAVFGPAPVTIIPGQVTFLYALGAFGTSSFSVISRTATLSGATASALNAQSSGAGCGGVIGASTPAPAFGEPFSVTLSASSFPAAAELFIGDSATDFGPFSLPLDLTGFGAPGCFLGTSIVANLPSVVDGQGNAAVTLALDPILAPGFGGAFFQYAILDPAANPLGVVLSDVLSVLPSTGPEVELRVVHASPDAPAVDVYVQGLPTPVLQNLSYTETSEFLGLAAGSVVVEVRAAGSAPTSPPAFVSGSLSLSAGQKLTVVAAGLLGSTAPADQFRLLVYDDGFNTPAAGNAQVRIIHASPDAPSVDLDVGDDGTSEVTGLARFGETGASGVALPAGSPLQVAVLAGSPAVPVTRFTSILPAEPLYLIAIGLVGQPAGEPDGFALLPVLEGGSFGIVRQNPVIYVLHSSPDTGPVDVSTGGASLVNGISFGQLSAPLQVPPGTYALDIAPAGTGNPVASQQTPYVAAGTRYLAVATGFTTATVSGAPFQLQFLEDAFVLDPTNAQVQIVHNSPDAPTIDLGLSIAGQLVGPALFAGVSFGDVAPIVTAPQAMPTIGLAPTGFVSPAISFDLTLNGGLRAFALASGSISQVPGIEPFRLLIVATDTTPWSLIDVAPNP